MKFVRRKRYTRLYALCALYALANSPQPLGDILKALLIRYVINKHDAHRSAVVRGRDRVKTLLACRIPYLQFDFLSVKLDRLYLEIDA